MTFTETWSLELVLGTGLGHGDGSGSGHCREPGASRIGYGGKGNTAKYADTVNNM